MTAERSMAGLAPHARWLDRAADSALATCAADALAIEAIGCSVTGDTTSTGAPAPRSQRPPMNSVGASVWMSMACSIERIPVTMGQPSLVVERAIRRTADVAHDPSVTIAPDAPRTWFELLFLSFTNLTSVGLSDITPILAQARSWVMIEQVAGLMYVALVVSRIVGLTITRQRA